MRTEEKLQADGNDGSPRQPDDPRRRTMLNWFGALFGVIVLIGGSILYFSGGSGSSDDGEPAAAHQDATEDDHMEDEHDGEDVHEEGDSSKGDKGGAVAAGDVIEIEMVEFGFVPETIEIPAGTPVTLRFTNTGSIVHEAMIGDSHMQEEYAAQGDHDNHTDEGHHGELMAVTVESGQTADLEVQIDEPGEWMIGCHLTGHWEAGMFSTINVTT